MAIFIINVLSGEIQEDTDNTVEMASVRDGAVVDGPRCSYCANTRWKIKKVNNKQYCTRCNRAIDIQTPTNDNQEPGMILQVIEDDPRDPIH